MKQTLIWFNLQRDGTKKNVKKKYLMCQEATPNSSLLNLKIYLSKRCTKTSQRWIYVDSLPAMFLPSYRANTAILNIWIFSRRYHFRLKVFASAGEYISYWHWRVYHPVCYKVNDAKTFKNPWVSSCLFICRGSTTFIESTTTQDHPAKEHLLIWNSETTQNLNIYLRNYHTHNSTTH